jgi:hypothetical protein
MTQKRTVASLRCHKQLRHGEVLKGHVRRTTVPRRICTGRSFSASPTGEWFRHTRDLCRCIRSCPRDKHNGAAHRAPLKWKEKTESEKAKSEGKG